jgi:hypothetical protein
LACKDHLVLDAKWLGLTPRVLTLLQPITAVFGDLIIRVNNETNEYRINGTGIGYPGYLAGTDRFADIAVVRLDREAVLIKNYVQTIALPPKFFKPSLSYTPAVSYGWGLDNISE